MTTRLTAKGATTRARIVEGAADEIRKHGVTMTTLDDIGARTHTSRGQLFHYFPGGKEELLLAVAEHEAGRVLDDQQPHLDHLDSWAAWGRWRDAVLDRYRQQGSSCPLSTLMSELGRSTPAARKVTRQLLAQWESAIIAGIGRMQRSGRIAADVDAVRAGRAMLAGIQGGVSILLSTGDLSHLEAALDAGIASLRTG
jgi:AcrR family transcriptional regulator